jgi:zinc and cadmium transporter
MSDLLPEIEFHTHDRFLLTVTLVAGVAAAMGLSLLEPAAVQPAPVPSFKL